MNQDNPPSDTQVPPQPAYSDVTLKQIFTVIGIGSVVMSPFILFATLVSLVPWFFHRTVSTTVTVTGHLWERTVDLETYQTVSDNGWQHEVPENAVNVQCHKRKRDIEKANSNKYGTYCLYDIDRWKFTNVDATFGGPEDKPHWPAALDKYCETAELGCERQGARRERYLLKLEEESGRPHTCEVPHTDWQAISVGTQFKATVGKQFVVIDCQTLEPT